MARTHADIIRRASPISFWVSSTTCVRFIINCHSISSCYKVWEAAIGAGYNPLGFGSTDFSLWPSARPTQAARASQAVTSQTTIHKRAV